MRGQNRVEFLLVRRKNNLKFKYFTVKFKSILMIELLIFTLCGFGFLVFHKIIVK
jgi:hypothetical protein